MLRPITLSHRFAMLVITVCLAILPVAAQDTADHARHHPQPSARQADAKPSANQGSDYLVRVGKHIMWKSQVEKMHPEMKSKMVTISKKNNNDFLVQVGKKTVWASTIRRDPNAETKPASHDSGCKDFLVQVGKKSEWASAVDCPMGTHSKEAKPLCCVAPVSAEKELPKCCADAQK